MFGNTQAVTTFAYTPRWMAILLLADKSVQIQLVWHEVTLYKTKDQWENWHKLDCNWVYDTGRVSIICKMTQAAQKPSSTSVQGPHVSFWTSSGKIHWLFARLFDRLRINTWTISAALDFHRSPLHTKKITVSLNILIISKGTKTHPMIWNQFFPSYYRSSWWETIVHCLLKFCFTIFHG